MCCDRNNPPHPRRARRPRIRAFSLVEIMVVLVIIGLLAALVTINVRGYLATAKVNAARADLATLATSLESFYLAHDRYPTSDEGLGVLTRSTSRLTEPLLTRLPPDPWGRAYVYNQPGRDGQPYEVMSLGADGREGGEGADADIGSWDVEQRDDEPIR